MICIGCHHGVPLDWLTTHSKNHHPGRTLLSSAEQGTIVEELANGGYRSSKAEKYHQTPGQKPIDGVEVLEGFRCPLLTDDGSECSKAFVAPSTFTRHLCNHPAPPDGKPDPSSCASYVQTLFRQGGQQSYFSVDPSLSDLDPSSASAYRFAVDALRNLPKPEIPLLDHDKDRSSIHWFTRWPELLKPYVVDQRSVRFLLSLISFPEPESDSERSANLRDHGRRWWKKAEAAHIGCTFRASTLLKSHQQRVFPFSSPSPLLTCYNLGTWVLGKFCGSQTAHAATVGQRYHSCGSVSRHPPYPRKSSLLGSLTASAVYSGNMESTLTPRLIHPQGMLPSSRRLFSLLSSGIALWISTQAAASHVLSSVTSPSFHSERQGGLSNRGLSHSQYRDCYTFLG